MSIAGHCQECYRFTWLDEEEAICESCWRKAEAANTPEARVEREAKYFCLAVLAIAALIGLAIYLRGVV